MKHQHTQIITGLYALIEMQPSHIRKELALEILASLAAAYSELEALQTRLNRSEHRCYDQQTHIDALEERIAQLTQPKEVPHGQEKIDIIA